jgi:mannonate dehydratase
VDRRDFVRAAGAGLVGAMSASTKVAVAAAETKAASTATPKVGTQHGSTNEILDVLATLGVNHICGRLPSDRLDEQWSVEGLTRFRERVESFGIHLDMLPLPLSSVEIGQAENPNILLGKSPERDREIDGICQMIRNAARAGIPALKYTMSILGVVRTAPTPGRGSAKYSAFKYATAEPQSPTIAGPVTADDYWERITYFLERVVPVAEEYKVRLCCHPHDPGMPEDTGYRGVHTVLGSVEGLKRFIAIKESPYHGLNFCQGTVAEMLKDPGREIFDVIRYFGQRKKIFNVHFRNIKGGFLDFRETFIDDGDVDMLQAVRVYKEVGYDGMLMPDHVPPTDADPGRLQAFAYTFGYIKALIRAA